ASSGEVEARAGAAANATAPTVAITAPANGATVSGKTSLMASASADAGVARGDFRVDGTIVGRAYQAAWTVPFDTKGVVNGSHLISAQAVSTSGNASAAASAGVTVSNPQACTWYVSPAGSPSNTGRASTSPLSLEAVTSRTI